VQVTPGVNFKRDTTTGTVEAGECDGSSAIPILSSIMTDSNGVSVLNNSLVSVVGAAFLSTSIPDNYTTGSLGL
jgi:sphingomyelin phosphodiesterase